MKPRAIGSLQVSEIGLGCNQFGSSCDEAQTAAIVGRALDLGVTFFDTAEEYGDGESERLLGLALRGRRDQAVIATKFAGNVDGVVPPGRAAAMAVRAAAEASLGRLGTDRIDLYQLHFPDPATPVAETLEALDALVREGKVREIGCCNFSAAQVDEAAQISAREGWAAFASVQNRLNLARQEALDDVVPACVRHGLAFLPYFPLAAGALTGKYRRGEAPPADTRLGGRYVSPDAARKILNDQALDRVARLEAFASARGRTVSDLAIAWLLAQPAVASVIAGATRPEQVEANAAASMWRLSAAEAGEAAALARV